MTEKTGRLAAIRECFREAMHLDATAVAVIDEQTDAADLAAWDSQGHIRLIVALEKRFGVEFGDDQVVELVSVKDILKALDARV
jgi:acyl carrier protein